MPTILSFRDFLSQHAGLLAVNPFWALWPAVLAGVLYKSFRTPWLLSAVAVWACYPPYELLMQSGLFCRADCSPRAELLPVLGILWAVTLLALGEVLIIAFRRVWIRMDVQRRSNLAYRKSLRTERSLHVTEDP